jgi:hypothetical protein
LDTDVLVKETQREENWEMVDVKVLVETDGEEAAFRVFQEEMKRRYPLSQLLIRSGVKWKNQWVNVRAW